MNSIPADLIPNIWRVELSGRCDLSCRACPFKVFHKNGQFIDDRLFLRLIKEIWHLSPGARVELHNGGEPLLHPHFNGLMNQCNALPEKGSFYCSTNGQNLDKKRAEIIVESGKWSHIIFSVDALSQDTFSKIRYPGILEKTNNAIKNVIYSRLKHRALLPSVVVQFVVQPENSHEAIDFYQYWRSFFNSLKIDHILHFDVNPPMPRDCICIVPCTTSDLESQREMNLLFERVMKDVSDEAHLENARQEYTEVPVREIQKKHAICSMPWNMIAVSASGEVTPCCSGDSSGRFTMGNAHHENLLSIWMGKSFQDLRRMHLNQNTEHYFPCGNCFSKVSDNFNLKRAQQFLNANVD